MCDTCRGYGAAIEYAQGHYKYIEKSLFCKWLADLRRSDVRDSRWSVTAQRSVLDRVDAGYQCFFSRRGVVIHTRHDWCARSRCAVSSLVRIQAGVHVPVMMPPIPRVTTADPIFSKIQRLPFRIDGIQYTQYAIERITEPPSCVLYAPASAGPSRSRRDTGRLRACCCSAPPTSDCGVRLH